MKKYLLKISEITKNNPFVDKTVNSEILAESLLIAQKKYIDIIIGTKLLNQLLEEVENNNLTPENENLLNNFIKPALSKYTIFEAIEYLDTKIENIGILTKSTDNSQNLDFKKIQALKNKLINDADFYGNELKNEIFANKHLYPLIEENVNCINEKLPSKNKPFRTSIYFPKK